ncbi:hypothetical protein [Fredinandcohnia sp. 179-A 10B2 NHS]|uniref:hypothetical protein n=1 Tax=Fredinandcohnia sp. 179-A 10B2 NHS TaxID=3235176 RepID=UPI0039A130AF
MRYIILFGTAFLLGILFAFLEISEPFGLIIALLITFILGFYLFVFPIHMEKNVEKLEKFIEKRRKNPIFKLYYGIGNRIDQDVKEATDILLKKYKQPARQALFKTLFALYEKDILRAKDDVEEIKPPEYKRYYQAVIATEEGNIEKAEALVKEIKSEWMRHALLAGIAEKNNDQNSFKEHIQKAFEKTRGLQRYIIYKQYEMYLKSR